MKSLNKENIDGVLLVDKAPEMTSHDVVAIARRAADQKKIGHCGTLDPLATGLLILVLGRATKIQDLLMSEHKVYEGTFKLGAATSSQDKDGEIIEEKPVPDLTMEQLNAAFSEFTGDFSQIPPMVSAIKKNGVPLYKLARQGKTIEREPRPVHVFSYDILRFESPEVDFRVKCSKGFYVRTYAHEIGIKLGTLAHLTALRRTESGRFDLSRAMPCELLKTATREQVQEYIISLPEVSRMRGA